MIMLLDTIANSGQIWAMQTSTAVFVLGEMEYSIRQLGKRERMKHQRGKIK